MIKWLNNSLVSVLFLLILIVPLILPYFHSGYFPTHDGEWAVVRLADMFRGIRDHQFPVRYSGNLNFGYGYPLFNFTYPAPYYLGIIFHIFKIGFVDTIKLLFALSVVVSVLSMYFLSSEIWKSKLAGIISGLLYVYFPYRIVDLYARGSIGESLSFALFPLILFCLSKMLTGKNVNRYMVFGSINYALLIMTHNIMALLFSPLVLIFIVTKICFQKHKHFFHIVFFFLLSFSLSAFFWLPALIEKPLIRLSQIPIADRSIYFVHINQLVIPQWGYGLPDHSDGFSYQVGLPYILIGFIICCFLLYSWFTKNKKIKTYPFQISTIITLTTILSILLMFSFTAVIWQVTPLLKEINYPWTLLGPIGFMISLLAGFLWIQNKFLKYGVLVLCILAVLMTVPHAKPIFYIDKGDNYYLTNDATTTSSKELMPLWVKNDPIRRPDNKIEIIKGKGSIQNVYSDSHIINFDLTLQTNSIIRINTIYYPGWNITIDGKDTQIQYNNSGVIDEFVSAGNHKIQGKFSETMIRLFSDLFSLVGLVVLLLCPVFLKKT